MKNYKNLFTINLKGKYKGNYYVLKNIILILIFIFLQSHILYSKEDGYSNSDIYLHTPPMLVENIATQYILIKAGTYATLNSKLDLKNYHPVYVEYYDGRLFIYYYLTKKEKTSTFDQSENEIIKLEFPFNFSSVDEITMKYSNGAIRNIFYSFNKNDGDDNIISSEELKKSKIAEKNIGEIKDTILGQKIDHFMREIFYPGDDKDSEIISNLRYEPFKENIKLAILEMLKSLSHHSFNDKKFFQIMSVITNYSEGDNAYPVSSSAVDFYARIFISIFDDKGNFESLEKIALVFDEKDGSIRDNGHIKHISALLPINILDLNFCMKKGVIELSDRIIAGYIQIPNGKRILLNTPYTSYSEKYNNDNEKKTIYVNAEDAGFFFAYDPLLRIPQNGFTHGYKYLSIEEREKFVFLSRSCQFLQDLDKINPNSQKERVEAQIGASNYYVSFNSDQ